MASFKNIFCGCGMWLSKAGVRPHAGSPRHAAWALKQGRSVAVDQLRPLAPGPIPSLWGRASNG